MMSFGRIRTLAKKALDPSLVGTGNLAANLIGALLWLTLASLMTTEDYGQVNFYIAIASVASGVSLLGLNTMIMTFIPKGNETIVRQANSLVLILSSIGAVAVAIITTNLPTALLLLALSAFAMTIGEALGRKHYRRYTLIMIACRGSQFGLAMSLYYAIGINGIILGYAIPAIILGFRFFSVQKLQISFTEIKSRSGFVTHSYSLSLFSGRYSLRR